jgi:hypothetical protein
MIQLVLGLIIVMSGVGGVETSQSDLDLLYSALTASFGLMVMASGVKFVKVGEK